MLPFVLLHISNLPLLWGFFFAGFALAVMVIGIEGLASSALILLAMIGFALAYWDYQIQSKFKNTTVTDNGGEEDGI